MFSLSPVFFSLQLEVCASPCQSEPGDHVSIRPNNGHTNKLMAKVNSRPTTPRTFATSAHKQQTDHTLSDGHLMPNKSQGGVVCEGRGGVVGGGSIVRKDRRKRRRQAIEEELDTSSDEDHNPKRESTEENKGEMSKKPVFFSSLFLLPT